jgi:hypothetical protein
MLHCPANSQLHCLIGFLSQYFTAPLTHSSTASPASCCNASLTHSQLPNLTAQLPHRPPVAMLHCPAHSFLTSLLNCLTGFFSQCFTDPLPHSSITSLLYCLSCFLSLFFAVPLPCLSAVMTKYPLSPVSISFAYGRRNTWNAHRCPVCQLLSLHPPHNSFRHLLGTITEYIA